MSVMIVKMSNWYKYFDKFNNKKYSITKKAAIVTSKNKVTTERILIEFGKMFQVVIQILYKQEVWSLIHKVRWRYFWETKNSIKLLDPYRTRGDYIQYSVAID